MLVTRTRLPRLRPGFTLIEMMVVTVLTVVVLGAMVTTLARQQKFYRSAAQLLEARSQVRQTTAILPNDLRGVSTVGNDIVSMNETEIVLRATFGASVVCALNSGNIVLPPVDPAAGNVASNWETTPAQGDLMFVFDDGPTPNAADDSWQLYTLGNNVGFETGTCPTSTGLTTAADAGKSLLRVNTTVALSPTIAVGAPVRFVRQTRYSLFQAANGKWYLGYCSPACDAGGPQPIAGPLVPVGAGTAGVRFTYLDANAAVTAVPSQVAQVSIGVSAQTDTKIGLTGFQTSIVGDSLRLVVAIRNRQ